MSNDTTILTESMKAAVVFCAEKAGLDGWEQVAESRAQADCKTCKHLRYGLAKTTADYIGSLDSTVRAVYVFDPEAATHMDSQLASPRRLSPGVSLLIWASHKTAALDSLLISVRQAADEEHWRLPCPEANALCYALDTIVVDDQDVQERRGYGALINSIFVLPTEIWNRETAGLVQAS